jgi:phosphatidylserine/phosphatidylglycerophosphate/cardiolipin synthase-like enzyme
MTSSLISAIVHSCTDAPKAAIEKACTLLFDENTDAQAALPKLTGILAKETVAKLKRGLKGSATTARELALAMLSTSAGIEAGRASPDIQLVWTGPDIPMATPRDTLPQMLEMIGRAKTSILLVTFAAFKATAIMDALQAADARGVRLMIVVESAVDSAGQLTHDAYKAFPKSLIASGCVWHWPIEKRPKNQKGLPGKLHAKCLVIDNSEALVSSANLTDDAMERNIEVGIRCSNFCVAKQLGAKFEALAKVKVLLKVNN